LTTRRTGATSSSTCEVLQTLATDGAQLSGFHLIDVDPTNGDIYVALVRREQNKQLDAKTAFFKLSSLQKRASSKRSSLQKRAFLKRAGRQSFLAS
jgi:hypothetical protein